MRDEPIESRESMTKVRAAWELAVGYTLILAVIWTERPWQRLLYCAAAVFLAVALCLSFPGWKAMGLRTANLARSLWVVGAALLAAAIAVLVAAHMGTLAWPGGPVAFLHRYLGYAIWAILQQVLLQDFFLLRFLRILRSPRAAAVAAALTFTAAHLPNPILTAVTLLFGLISCALFLRYRNLYPLAVAHAILGITIGMTIPGPVVRNMRVGIGYLTYPRHHFRPHQRSH
jgi:membrane protease YdiL (CAAX protease family)